MSSYVNLVEANCEQALVDTLIAAVHQFYPASHKITLADLLRQVMSHYPVCTCREMCLGGVQVYLDHDGSALLTHASDALDHHVAGSHVYEGWTGGHQGHISSRLVT
jgi:hypothetical protein